MDSTTIIGAAGALILLLAFVLDETRAWNREEFRYDAANLVGGALLVWYAYSIGSWPFLVLNAIWTFVALRDVARRLRQ